ncbi:hypothetical protein ACFQ07_12745, partial [Actinomadura adrarensis]
ERDPAYQAAAERLLYLPDLGAALIQRARQELGEDTPYERLVIHADQLRNTQTDIKNATHETRTPHAKDTHA